MFKTMRQMGIDTALNKSLNIHSTVSKAHTIDCIDELVRGLNSNSLEPLSSLDLAKQLSLGEAKLSEVMILLIIIDMFMVPVVGDGSAYMDTTKD
jgi:hypothetical protein